MSTKTLIRGGTVLTMDPAIGDLPQGDVLIEDDKIAAVEHTTIERRRRGRRRRPAASSSPGSSTPTGTPGRPRSAACAPERHARRLLRRDPGHLRARSTGREDVYASQPRRLAGVPQRRHHHAGRLVAHQQHARAPRRRDPRPAGDRDPRPVRLRQREHLAGRLLVREQDRHPGRRRTPGPRHLLLLRRRAAHHGAGHPRARLLRRRRGARRVGAGPRARHPDHRARRRWAGWPAGSAWSSSSTTSACSARTPPTSTAATSATRSGSWSPTAGGTISIAPQVEMQMGHGWPPVMKAMRVRLRPSLSIDVVTTVPGDMFTQMRAAFGAERARVNAEFWQPNEPAPRPC